MLRNVRPIEELRTFRRRIVAAQDERAKKLERDIHDGAQQQLVALAVKQRLAASLIGKDDEGLRTMLEGLQAETTDVLENLRDLARGIYPLLADRGLAEALGAQARKASIPVHVESDGIARYPQEVESALYFCCLEALQNVAKYANATRVDVRLSESADELAFEVRDDGQGFEASSARRGEWPAGHGRPPRCRGREARGPLVTGDGHEGDRSRAAIGHRRAVGHTCVRWQLPICARMTSMFPRSLNF